MERKEYIDPTTGRHVLRWTASDARDQHLYFTSPSVTADDHWLVFLSERSGSPNLHVIHRQSAEISQLSRNSDGMLHSYVYPTGNDIGLGKASPCLDERRNRVLYIQGRAILGVDIPDGEPEVISELPEGWWTGFTHISPDGASFCVPIAQEEAFVDPAEAQGDQMDHVFRRFKAENLLSRILVYGLPDGELKHDIEVPFWVTHVQYDPSGTGRLIFNEEGGRRVTQRIWCLELDGTYRPLSPQPEDAWWSHENWDPRGERIVYHGGKRDRTGNFVAARTWDGELVYEHILDGIDFVHATLSQDGAHCVIDQRSGLVSLVETATGKVTPICRHDTDFSYQDAHAHPLENPSGSGIVFTSDREGTCNVYEVPKNIEQ